MKVREKSCYIMLYLPNQPSNSATATTIHISTEGKHCFGGPIQKNTKPQEMLLVTRSGKAGKPEVDLKFRPQKVEKWWTNAGFPMIFPWKNAGNWWLKLETWKNGDLYQIFTIFLRVIYGRLTVDLQFTWWIPGFRNIPNSCSWCLQIN